MLVEHILATRSGSDIGFYNKGGGEKSLVIRAQLRPVTSGTSIPSAINSPSCRFSARTSAANCRSD